MPVRYSGLGGLDGNLARPDRRAGLRPRGCSFAGRAGTGRITNVFSWEWVTAGDLAAVMHAVRSRPWGMGISAADHDLDRRLPKATNDLRTNSTRP